MTEEAIVKALSSAPGGVVLAAALVFVLYKVLSKVADRYIAALDRLSTAVTEHTAIDLKHHAEVRESVVRLETKVDSAIDWRDRTPSERMRRVEIDDQERERRRRIQTAPLGHRVKLPED